MALDGYCIFRKLARGEARARALVGSCTEIIGKCKYVGRLR